MTHSSARGLLLVLACVVVGWAPCSRAEGADLEAQLGKATGQPVVFASIASVERLIGEFNYVMDSIDRHDIVENVRELRERYQPLKGIDAKRPMGAVMYLNFITPVFVAFVPIENRDDFVAALGTYTLEVEQTDKNEYTIRGGPAPLFAVIRDDYAYISDSKPVLQREFSQPVETTKKLHGEYDLGITCHLTAVPSPVRGMLVESLLGGTDETENKADKADQSLDKIMRDALMAVSREADHVTLGWSVNRQERQARLDLVLSGTRDSDLARRLNSLKAIRSESSRLISPSAGFEATAAFELNSSFSETLSDILGLAIFGSGDDENENEKDETEKKIAKVVEKIAENSFEDDRIDMACGFEGKPGKFVFLMGWRSPHPEKLAKNFEELRSLDSEVEKVDEYLGAVIYRDGLPDDSDDELFGRDAGWYYAVAESMTWLAVGGENTLPVLKTAIDRMGERSRVAAQRAPLDITFHAQKLQLFEDEDDSETRKLFEKAFSAGDDRMQLELSGIEDGLRLRGSLGDGFIRACGLSIVAGLNDMGLLKRLEN